MVASNALVDGSMHDGINRTLLRRLALASLKASDTRSSRRRIYFSLAVLIFLSVLTRRFGRGIQCVLPTSIASADIQLPKAKNSGPVNMH